MLFGASSPAAKSRPRLIDLNLIPPEYRRRPFPFITTGLALLAVGSLVLLYAIFYAKTYSDLEVSSLSARVAQARSVVQLATGNPTAIAEQNRLRAMRDDYHALAARQIHWGDVFQVVGAVPPGVLVKTVSQSGFGVTVTGSAASAAAASRYLEQLRGSGLFVKAALQMNPSSDAQAFETPTVVPTRPPPIMTPRSAPIVLPPTSEPRQISYPTPRPQPTATATRRPSTPTVTPTATITPTPTPAFDYVLASSKQLPAANPNVGDTDIRGTVLDSTGKPFPGVPIEIDSEGSPPWTDTTTTAADGTFDFTVTHGKFTVFPQSGNPQKAVDLYTGADGVPGSFNYQLVFKATFSGTVPPTAVGTLTPTPTYTTSPTITPTPISPGPNVAALGCASSYMVQNGVVTSVPGSSNPNLAIDGNLGTEWNAGIAPSNGIQVIWQWSLPRPGTPIAGCAATGLSDSQDQIDGFQLIPDQNPAGDTTHELWLYSDPGCTTNVASTNTAYYTWQGYTTAGEVLPLRIEPPLPIRCVIVRTLVDPSNVAWEEVQIFQELAPPGGFPTLTPTATATSGTATATASATTTVAATAAPTATLTMTSTPLAPYPGLNVAPLSEAISASTTNGLATQTPIACQGSPTPTVASTSNPCAAIDGSLATFWAPSANAVDPQQLTLEVTSSEFRPGTDVIGDVRVVVESSSSSAEIYQVWAGTIPGETLICQFPSASTPVAGFQDGAVLDCPFPTPQATATPVLTAKGVSVVMYHSSSSGSQVEDGTHGIREIQVYKVVNPGSLDATRATSATAQDTVKNSVNLVPNSVGRGQGPGDAAPGIATPTRQPGQAGPPSTPPPTLAVGVPAADRQTPVVATTGPVDFTIILEVQSGSGYP